MTPEQPTPPITAVILAGGLGRRMDGSDKGLVPLAGRPLVSHVIDHLVDQPLEQIVICANRNLDRYSALGLPVISDILPDFAGPLAGLHAAMHRFPEHRILQIPCDLPQLPNDLVMRLSAAIAAPSTMAAVACDENDHHTAIIMAEAALLPSLDTFLSQGHRKLIQWLEQENAARVRFTGQQWFHNINTYKRLAEIERQLQQE